jgi:hypothetical protein
MPMLTIHRLSRCLRLALQCIVLTVSSTTCAVADACTLEALLRMPLEQLLELRVGQPQCPSGQPGGSGPQPHGAARGRP